MERLIIEPGFCTLCGVCEAACPVHAIKIEHGRPHRLHECSDDIDSCPICYDTCPHTDALMFETLRSVVDAPHRRENLGYYREILLAHATNPTLRDASRSGGVVTALLNFAVNQRIIDSAVVSEASSRVPIKIEPSISLVPDDTLSAVDAKIVPSAVAEAFGRAVFEHGRISIAFVGVPCHIVALRKLQAWQHRMMSSLRITIGLFCLWTFSLGQLLEYLLDKHNIAANEIQDVDLTANEYVVTTEDRTVRIPLSEAKHHIMNRCKTCTYFTSQLADISVGRAAPLRDWSTVIIRTAQGEEFFSRAVKEDIITTKKIETQPEALASLLQLASYKRQTALQEIAVMKEAGVPVPTGVELYYKATSAEITSLREVKVGDIMTKNVISIAATATVDELLDEIAKHHHIGFPVVDESNRVAGIVTLQDAMKTSKKTRDSVTVARIATKNLVMAFPEESVAEALEKMSKHDVGRLLVVDKKGNLSIIGILTRSDVMHALRKNY